jgi:hypothetical protein
VKRVGCKVILFIIFISAASTSLAELPRQDPNQSTSIPESAIQLFKSSGLDRLYEFSSHLKPSFLQGDFDGDGKPDIAVLVRQKKSRKLGIAVCHSSTKKVLFVGAGTEMGNGGDNFDWMDTWSVTRKSAAAKKLGKATAGVLKGDALHVEKSESASALVYWNGRRYVWYQMGD